MPLLLFIALGVMLGGLDGAAGAAGEVGGIVAGAGGNSGPPTLAYPPSTATYAGVGCGVMAGGGVAAVAVAAAPAEEAGRAGEEEEARAGVPVSLAAIFWSWGGNCCDKRLFTAVIRTVVLAVGGIASCVWRHFTFASSTRMAVSCPRTAVLVGVG